jgi:hypothetical protein
VLSSVGEGFLQYPEKYQLGCLRKLDFFQVG